jgi:hypothetical protein
VVSLLPNIKVVQHIWVKEMEELHSFFVLKKEKDDITLLSKFDNKKTFLSSEFNKYIPRIVVIAGDVVLHKTIETDASFAEALPFFSPSEFYFNAYPNKVTTTVTLAKRSSVDNLVELEMAKNPVTTIYLGELAAYFYKLEDEQDELLQESEIQSPNYTIKQQNKEVTDIAPQLNKGATLEAFAKQIFELHQLKLLPSIHHVNANKQADDFNFIWKWKHFALYFLGCILLVLLVNFVVFQSLYKETALLPAQVVTVQDEINDLQQSIYNLRKEQLAKNGNFALLSDKLALEVPDKIVLTLVALNPMENEEGRLRFLKNKLKIDGVSPSSKDVNVFIQQLQKTTVFRDVNLEYIKMIKSGVEFSITIQYD